MLTMLKADTHPRVYEYIGVMVKVKSSSDRPAMVHDRDSLIFCISQIIFGMNDEKSRINWCALKRRTC